MGSYPFGFEKSSKFLFKLLQQDHEGRSYEEIVAFPKTVEKISEQEVADTISMLYDWDKQIIVVLGPKSLKKQLEQFGKVKVISYKKYL